MLMIVAPHLLIYDAEQQLKLNRACQVARPQALQQITKSESAPARAVTLPLLHCTRNCLASLGPAALAARHSASMQCHWAYLYVVTNVIFHQSKARTELICSEHGSG
jgi:hypothetical protein